MNTSVMTRDDRELAPVPSEAVTIMQVIERAAANPAFDPDKMERLLQMQERILDRNARAAYTAALAEMQPQLPVIVERGGIKDRSGNVQSTYAKWEDINDAIKPLLSQFGFALSFRTGQEEGRIVVTGVLSHREGHSEQTTIHLPHDASGSKNAVQAVGSSTSYGKRYTAIALLNITSRGEDDDGRAGGAEATVTSAQASEIRKLIDAADGDVRGFCEFMKIDGLHDLPASQFDRAKKVLARRKAQLDSEREKGGALS